MMGPSICPVVPSYGIGCAMVAVKATGREALVRDYLLSISVLLSVRYTRIWWPRHISEITTQKLSLQSASHVYRFDDAAFELWLLDGGVVDFELKTRLRRLGIR